jgi:hypothetical protein
MFPLLQSALFSILILAVALELAAQMRAGFGAKGLYQVEGAPATLVITRSAASMNVYYGAYAAISGVLVALCLTADAAKNHRVFWVLADVFVSSYLCLFNTCFRLHLQDLAEFLTRVETR